jgi:cytochrome c oxidase subunit II
MTEHGADVALRIERRWAYLAFGIVGLLTLMAAVGGIHQALMPQAQLETVDPRTLHIRGEFVEANLGSAIEADGSVTVRLIGQQYSFTPQCILVPARTKLTFRATSADVVHGFLIAQTNLNQMVVPGYVSDFQAKFDQPGEHAMPCHEFCGVGHEGMWAKVKVIEPEVFRELAQSKASDGGRLSCVD